MGCYTMGAWQVHQLSVSYRVRLGRVTIATLTHAVVTERVADLWRAVIIGLAKQVANAYSKMHRLYLFIRFSAGLKSFVAPD